MTTEAKELLSFLATRSGIVLVRDDALPALHELHDLGYVAINKNAAKVTDEGMAAINPK